MFNLPEGSRIIQSDKIAVVWRLPNGNCVAQGKRVGKDCPLTPDERRMYVEELARPAIICKRLMELRNISLGEAWRLVKLARGFENLNEERRKHNWGV